MDENYQLYPESDLNTSHPSYSSRILFRAPVEPYLASNRSSLINSQEHYLEDSIPRHTNQKILSKYLRTNYFSEQISSLVAPFSPTIDNSFKNLNTRQGSPSEQAPFPIPVCRTVLSESWSSRVAQRETQNQVTRGEAARVSLHTSPTTICLKHVSSPPLVASPRSADNFPEQEISTKSSHTYLVPPESKQIVKNVSDPGGESFKKSLSLRIFGDFKQRPRETYLELKQYSTGERMASPTSLSPKRILPAGLPTIRRMRRSRRLVVCQLQQRKC